MTLRGVAMAVSCALALASFLLEAQGEASLLGPMAPHDGTTWEREALLGARPLRLPTLAAIAGKRSGAADRLDEGRHRLGFGFIAGHHLGVGLRIKRRAALQDRLQVIHGLGAVRHRTQVALC